MNRSINRFSSETVTHQAHEEVSRFRSQVAGHTSIPPSDQLEAVCYENLPSMGDFEKDGHADYPRRARQLRCSGGIR